MFLLAVTDTEGKQVQINGNNIAHYHKAATGKGTVIAFSVVSNGAFLTMNVLDTPEQITTLVNAKLRK
ncbi:MAG: hypothetical protein ACT4OK_22125 [Gemmobacter sp.]